MDVEEFINWCRSRDRADLEDVARMLRSGEDSAEGEVGRLRATAALTRLLRKTGRRRMACAAAHRAGEAALAACARTGFLAADRDAATQVARAAADACRGLACGHDCPVVDELLGPFRPVMATA